jgi:hypothetical protein
MGESNITVFRPAGKCDFWGQISEVSEGGMGAMISGELEHANLLSSNSHSRPHCTFWNYVLVFATGGDIIAALSSWLSVKCSVSGSNRLAKDFQ